MVWADSSAMMPVSRIFKSSSRMTQPRAQQKTSSIHMLTSVGGRWRVRMRSSGTQVTDRLLHGRLCLAVEAIRSKSEWSDRGGRRSCRPTFAEVGDRHRHRFGPQDADRGLLGHVLIHGERQSRQPAGFVRHPDRPRRFTRRVGVQQIANGPDARTNEARTAGRRNRRVATAGLDTNGQRRRPERICPDRNGSRLSSIWS